MLDDISSITTRISEIQDRIASLSGQPAAPAGVETGPAGASGQTFAQSLRAARTPLPPITGSTRLPDAPANVAIPPASLGPLPPMPVTPGAANVMPLPVAEESGYDTLIDKYASQQGLEPALVRAVIKTESGGNPRSVSRAGAMGLMQLMPENVKEAGISDPFDPEQNIAAGTKQLAGLMAQYHGNLDLALAGYNAGPGNVRKYGGVPPFTETQNYIRRVRAAMEKG
jgi:soluble lytic murein transglycosylase-like protein